MEERKRLEAEFHNVRQADRLAMPKDAFEEKYSNQKFYAITRHSKQVLGDWMARCRGKKVLDYCCGTGKTSIEVAAAGGAVIGVDIAAVEVQDAISSAARAGVPARFLVMDAESLAFADATFDYLICNGVLHHLDLDRAYPELARVLKPGGEIICIEALGYNPIIALYRRLTPHLRTAWEAKHILTLRQVGQARRHFDHVEVRYFYLFTILAVPFRKTPVFPAVLGLLEAIDRLVLRVPGVQLMAWQMMFMLTRPRGADADLGHQGR